MSRATAKLSATPRFDSLEQEAYLNLWRAYDRLKEVEDEVFQRFGISPQQYNVLRLLAAHDAPMPTLAIADRMISRAPDITRMIDGLVELGFVARQRPTDDRRRVLVALTTAGRKMLARIADPLARCHNRQLGHLDRRELKQLIELLKRVRAPHEAANNPWK